MIKQETGLLSKYISETNKTILCSIQIILRTPFKQFQEEQQSKKSSEVDR
jgi:hypothetical protein